MISKLKARVAPVIKRRLGYLDSGRRSIEDSLTVLLYHEVSDDPSSFMNAPSLNVPPAVFAGQMDFIKGHFNIIDPDQLREGGFEQPAALVTFDDGMLGYFENAVPIMAEREIPSINFLNMDTIEGEASWAGLLTYLAEYDTRFQAKISGPRGGSPIDTTTIQPELVRDHLSTIGSENREELYGSHCHTA